MMKRCWLKQYQKLFFLKFSLVGHGWIGLNGQHVSGPQSIWPEDLEIVVAQVLVALPVPVQGKDIHKQKRNTVVLKVN